MVGGLNMERKRVQKRQIGLPVALAISAVLHLIIFILSVLMPVSLESVAAVEREESVLKFTFAPETDEDVEGRVEGMLPVPAPEQQAEADPDYQPSGLPSMQAPSSPQPPMPDSFPAEQLLEEAVEEQDVEELLEEEEAAAEEEQAPQLPREPEADLRGAEAEESAGTPAESSQDIDITRAIQDYGRALARAREATPPSSSGGGAARNSFVPDHTGLPPSGFGVGNLTFESRNYDWTDYARQIYILIWKAWHYRLYLTTDEFEKWGYQTGEWFLRHRSEVRFVIERNGQVTGIIVETPSGCKPLDDSAADALAEVILPPLPADFPKSREVVHAAFIAITEIMALRPGLREMKRRGMFGPDPNVTPEELRER
jgi:outer membrane biosynthesis protein TonB